MNRYVLVGMAAMALAIVAGPAQAMQDFYFVMRNNTAGPPYPTEPVEVMVSHEKKAGMPEAGMTETEIVGVGLTADNILPARIQAYGGGGGGGGAAISSFFDIFTEVSSDDYPADSFFDLFVEVRPPEGGGAVMIRESPTRAGLGDSFFDIFFQVDVPGGLEELHLHGAIPVEQPLTFTSAGTDNDCDSFFDIYIEVSTDGTINPELPLVTMELTGTFVPEPATWTLLGLGGLALVWLRRRKAA